MNDIPSSAFDQVPVETRKPGFYAEISAVASRASTYRALIVGQRLASGTVAAGVPSFISGEGEIAKTFFGRGSLIANMVTSYRAGESALELWAVALDDDGAGVAATLDITVTSAAIAAGTLSLYMGDTRIRVGVASGDDVSDIAASINAAINAATDLPVTSSVLAGVVTVTFRHKGALGNDFRVQLNYRGIDAGEETPAGVAITIPDDGYLTGGATDPDQTAAIAGIANETFDFILVPYSGTAELDVWDTELTERFGPLEQMYGGVFSCRRGTPSEHITWLGNRNDKYVSVTCVHDTPGPVWKTAARMLARASRSLANHPVRPLKPLELIGELPAPRTSRFTFSDANAILNAGGSTLEVLRDGTVIIDKIVTTYKTNAVGDADDAFRDIQSLYTSAYIARELRFVINRDFISKRAILVDDGTQLASGLPSVTPRTAKATLIAHYAYLERQGIVERADIFEKYLIVSREAKRLNFKYQPDLANPLDIVAVKIEFSIQFPDDLVGA